MYRKDELYDSLSRSGCSAMSDEALVAIAQTGSHAAFEELFKRHRNVLSRTVQRITRNEHDTEDALQDCSIKAFVHIKSFDGKSAFPTWLIRIGINTALMILRKRRRAAIASLDDHASSDLRGPWQVAELSNDPEQELLAREMQSQILQAVNRLPASLRTVMDAHRLREQPVKELAMMTGLTVAATKSRLYRARLAVRRSMQRMQKQSLGSLGQIRLKISVLGESPHNSSWSYGQMADRDRRTELPGI